MTSDFEEQKYAEQRHLDRIRIQAETIAYLEKGIRGDTSHAYPDWVYEAAEAIKHQNENIPWLLDLIKALGWQGGTIHGALRAVRRLVLAADTTAQSEPYHESRVF